MPRKWWNRVLPPEERRVSIKVLTEDIGPAPNIMTFEESVEVFGTMRSGARIHVDGNVTVYGSVEDATIDASGSVTIDGGFLGTGAGLIRCDGGFNARFVQGQRIEAKGDVGIESALLSSTVFSSSNVRVGQGQGKIIGGDVHAYGNVEAAVMGSQRPVTTRVEVGVNPVMTLRIERLEREAMGLTRKRIGFLKDLATASTRTEPTSQADSLVDMQAAADAIYGDLIAVSEEIINLRQRTRLNPDAAVVVQEASYPPLEISICFSRIMNEAVTGPVVFRLMEDRIIFDTWTLG
jgi:uncharacterized protein (DUF342 family)